jgi:hypothetical protein
MARKTVAFSDVKPQLSPDAVHLLHANRHERRRLASIDRTRGTRKRRDK